MIEFGFYGDKDMKIGLQIRKNGATGEHIISICQEDVETSKLIEVGQILSVDELKQIRDLLISELGNDAFEEVMEKLEATQKTERFLEDSIVQYLEDKDKGVVDENFLKGVLGKFRGMKRQRIKKFGRDAG
jgi:hypothetical protein